MVLVTKELRAAETAALENRPFVSSVSGKKIKANKRGKLKSFSAAGFLTAMIIVFGLIFSSGNIIPSAISERLIEETDIQYVDAVESKMIVFQHAMSEGSLPQNVIESLSKD